MLTWKFFDKNAKLNHSSECVKELRIIWKHVLFKEGTFSACLKTIAGLINHVKLLPITSTEWSFWVTSEGYDY